MEGLNFIKLFEHSVKENWNSIALTDYPGESRTYKEMAYSISSLHLYWKSIGLNQGDKIAICASNSSNWVITYFAIVTGGYIAVVIPRNITIEELTLLVDHSDSILLYTTKDISLSLSLDNLPKVLAVFEIGTNSLLYVGYQEQNKKLSSCPELVSHKISQDEINYYGNSADEFCTLLYTSGSTGQPKGVMLSSLNISDVVGIFDWFSAADGEKIHVNTVLPFYHVFGLMVEVIPALCRGMQFVILTLPCSPENICSVMSRYRPKYMITVPIVLQNTVEYILNDKLLNKLDEQSIADWQNHSEFFSSLRKEIVSSLGGRLELFYCGGAAIDSFYESLIVDKMQIPIVSGYGMTECCIVTVGSLAQKRSSCGIIYHKSDVRIAPSSFSSAKQGEIQARGGNVFIGYYKDPEATKAAFTEDGWFKTGDMGYIDEDDNLFITGRCKDMLLTSNGENIYPEEVESTMNASQFVKESILVQRGEKLYAVVVPDREKAEADGLDAEGLNKKIDETVREASKKLPGFTIISGFELRDEPLERTPKGSLKRYLYSDGIKEN